MSLLPLLFACLQAEVNAFMWLGLKLLDPDSDVALEVAIRVNRRRILLGEFGQGERVRGALAADFASQACVNPPINLPGHAERMQVSVRASHRLGGCTSATLRGHGPFFVEIVHAWGPLRLKIAWRLCHGPVKMPTCMVYRAA
jgi:hypothetical protein